MIILKNKSEIEAMKEGGEILKNILRHLASEIKPGITTLYLDKLAKELIKKNYGKPSFYKYYGFPANICTSINHEIVHGIPGEKILKNGDIISLDVGLKYKGFHTDRAITIPVGKVKPIYLKLIDITKKALEKAILKTKPGNHIGDISYIIQKTIEDSGFEPVKECTGHGIGRNLHEDPPVPNFGKNGEGPIIKEGMTLAIEPMAIAGKAIIKTNEDNWTISTFDGSFAAHFEQTIAVNKNGCLILS